MPSCGGCEGKGAHQKYCVKHPNYHPWRRLADQAEDIGDTIGGNSPGVANQAYHLSAQIRRLMQERPWKGIRRQVHDDLRAVDDPAPDRARRARDEAD